MAQAVQHLPGATAGTASSEAEVRHRAPTLEQVWLGLVVLAAAFASALQPLEPIDYWWSVRFGTLFRELGTIPTTDPIFYTPIRGPIIDGQWLGKTILSTLHDLGGIELSLALRSTVAIVAALLLARICRSVGAGPRISATVAGLSVVLFVPGLAVRPQLLAVVPFLVVWQAALHPPRSWLGTLAVGAVVAFWANVHGSFILIYPLLAVGILEAFVARARTGQSDRLRWALILAAVCGLAPSINPYGVGLAAYVGDTILFNGGKSASFGVLGVEWQAPALRSPYGGAFYLTLLLTTLLVGTGRRPRLGEGLLLIGFGLLAVSSVRHVIWWSLLFAPFVARALAELSQSAHWAWLPRPGPLPRGAAVPNAVCLVLFGALVLLALPWTRERLPLPEERTARIDAETPVDVANFLARNPREGRLFNDTDWSAFFAWRLGPNVQLFVDNRFELHPTEVWEEYATIAQGHVSWERRLDGYGVTRLALNPVTQRGLVAAVRETPGWRLVYEDRQALVFDRT